jgi:hypothetical protein
VAQADQIVDELDAKLAEVRVLADAEEATWTIAEREATIEAPPVEACCPKLKRCEALEKEAEETYARMHGAEESECERLAEEHRFADAMAKRARWSLTNDSEERVVVAHVYTDASMACCDEDASCCLSASIRDNPLTVAQPYDESFHLSPVGATVAVVEDATASNRTNAFVKAVSEDLKFHMDDSQALYKSSSTTGTALKI